MTTTLLRGGTVYTPGEPPATAMAVEDGTVVWVGRDAGARADEVVELDGALVTPAFVDAHVHATSTGLTHNGLDLAGCASLAEALDRLAAHARSRAGGVLLGHGWDDTRWPERRPPSREELDRATGGARVYLSRVDVHSAVVSSALLAAVPDVRGAVGFGESGWVSADAHHLVRRAALDSVTPDQRRAAQRATLRRATELGIGCLHELAGPEISSEDDLTGLLALAAEEPGPDVLAYWGELGAVDKARELGALGAAGDLFVDGAIGSRTAAVDQPYQDNASQGHLYVEHDQVAQHVIACTEAGIQAGFHAIGDQAVRAVTDGLAHAAVAVGRERLRAARHRVEHVEMVDAGTIATLAELGVVASVQPAFDAAWGGPDGMYAERLGRERALAMNPFAALADAGVTLAFGSDSPVTPLDPWGAVRAAVYHRNPEHRLTLDAAVAAHTRGGWRAVRRDDAGVLKPGAPATYAVWRTAAPGLPDLAPGTEPPVCLRTVVRGRTVFAREGALG